MGMLVLQFFLVTEWPESHLQQLFFIPVYASFHLPCFFLKTSLSTWLFWECKHLFMFSDLHAKGKDLTGFYYVRCCRALRFQAFCAFLCLSL